MLYDNMLFWRRRASGIISGFPVSEVKKVSERHPRSMQSSTMDAMMSVRIMKMWERLDLPASTRQKKTRLPQCHFAITASAAFGHSSDHGSST